MAENTGSTKHLLSEKEIFVNSIVLNSNALINPFFKFFFWVVAAWSPAHLYFIVHLSKEITRVDEV